MRRGSVVVMVIPGELGKPRPGIVVQGDELGDTTTSVLVCPLSSDIQDNARLRPLVEPTPENGLRLRSQVMTDKMLDLKRERLRTVIGTIDSETSDRLDRALLMVLGLVR